MVALVVCRLGAIAEFHRDAEEPVKFTRAKSIAASVGGDPHLGPARVSMQSVDAANSLSKYELSTVLLKRRLKGNIVSPERANRWLFPQL